MFVVGLGRLPRDNTSLDDCVFITHLFALSISHTTSKVIGDEVDFQLSNYLRNLAGWKYIYPLNSLLSDFLRNLANLEY